MNETAFYEVLDIEESENMISESKSENFIDKDKGVMKVGILGCGAIANLIADFALEGKLCVDLKCFYDRDKQRAEKLASRVDGTVASGVIDMLDQIDLVLEAASPQAVIENVPQILKNGKNVIIMSIGALINPKLKNRLENIARENNCRIYMPSGAVVGLDGVKAVSMGKIKDVSLLTRKPPESLGIATDKEIILYEGKASSAVRKFPLNMNVAASLSIACGREADVKIIADPKVDCNCHEIHVIGDFGEFKTTTQNRNCQTNPKTSVLAAYSAIKLLKGLNENFNIGT